MATIQKQKYTCIGLPSRTIIAIKLYLIIIVSHSLLYPSHYSRQFLQPTSFRLTPERTLLRLEKLICPKCPNLSGVDRH